MQISISCSTIPEMLNRQMNHDRFLFGCISPSVLMTSQERYFQVKKTFRFVLTLLSFIKPPDFNKLKPESLSISSMSFPFQLLLYKVFQSNQKKFFASHSFQKKLSLIVKQNHQKVPISFLS